MLLLFCLTVITIIISSMIIIIAIIIITIYSYRYKFIVILIIVLISYVSEINYPQVLSVTLELHSPTILFVIISGNVPLSQFITVCCVFSQILNYFHLRKSDVIKITRTHSMAMMMSDCLN